MGVHFHTATSDPLVGANSGLENPSKSTWNESDDPNRKFAGFVVFHDRWGSDYGFKVMEVGTYIIHDMPQVTTYLMDDPAQVYTLTMDTPGACTI